MTNRFLVVSSLPNKQLLIGDILSSFNSTHQPFFLITKAKRLLRRGQIEKWKIKPSLLPTWPPLIFIIFFPLLWLFFSLPFIFYLWRWKPSTVVLINWPEKVLFSAWVRLFKIKLVWFEYPEREFGKLSVWFKFFYQRFSKNVNFIVVGKKTAEALKSVLGDKNVSVILPAALAKNFQQQSIFKTLAEQTNRGRFVVGSVLYGLPRDQAERLLSALAIAQTVCPTIELVIIGEGKNRRQIQWLARRMNLERRVWLAGPTADFQRWVGQLNVYVIANKRPNLEDAAWAIGAMASGLPVVAPLKIWLEDIITPKNGVLTDINDPEILARQLINLQQENELCHKLGQESRLMAQQLSFDQFVVSFIKLLS